MSDFQVLIVGGGIAGSVAAYWIGKAGVQVTVVEKSPELRTAGQGIDIRGPAKTIVNQMGVQKAIEEKATKETGATFININNKAVATFDLGSDGSAADEVFTAEIEIMRKDLAEILHRAAASMPSVTYKFNTELRAIHEQDSKDDSRVKVDFSDNTSQTYDLVIGADGIGSQTRKAMLGLEAYKASFKPVGAYCAYFSIPAEPQDKPRARWYNTTRHRSMLIRPYTEKISSAYLNVVDETPELQAAYESNDPQFQKQTLCNIFRDAQCQETSRLLEALQAEPNFYFQRIVQVKIPPSSWSGSAHSSGRVTLVGDAAYCPSPFTGIGNSLAILGAYTLAAELVREIKATKTGEKPNLRKVLTSYEETLTPYVEEGQQIPGWGYLPRLLNPGSRLGCWMLSTFVWLFYQLSLIKLATMFGGESIFDKADITEFPI